jgi:hypothetical protein
MPAPMLMLLSGIVVAWSTFIVRRDRFLVYCILLTQITWHAPLILMMAFPFDIPIKSVANRPYATALVCLIHVIVAAGVIGYLSVSPRKRRDRRLELRFDKSIVTIAYVGAMFMAIDAFGYRTPLTADIGRNRVVFTNAQATVFGHIGIIVGGLALLLLMAKPAGLRTFLFYGGPYLIYSTTYLLVGNRQFMFVGLMLVALNALADRRPPFLKTIVWGSIAAVAFFTLMTVFGSLRQSQTKGVQDQALQSLMNTQILDYRTPFTRTYSLRTASLYLFMYYGIEYEMAGSIMRTVDYRAPFLSLTVPIVYRRFSSQLGLPDQGRVMTRVADEVEAKLGVYPNVWATMFIQAFYEGGWPYILGLTTLLSVINLYLTRAVTLRRTNLAVLSLTVFYACLIFGIMFAPTREGSIASMLLILCGLALMRKIAGPIFIHAVDADTLGPERAS